MGIVRIVIVDQREESSTCDQFQEVILSPDNYQRLTIPPKLWVGFQGIAEITSMMLNVANIEHCPDESSNVELGAIQFDWTNES